jgi:hypothetical protein
MGARGWGKEATKRLILDDSANRDSTQGSMICWNAVGYTEIWCNIRNLSNKAKATRHKGIK